MRQPFVRCAAAILMAWSIGPLGWAAGETGGNALARGIVELSKDHDAAALELFEQAMAGAPKSPEPVFFSAQALNRLGQHQKALDRLDRAGQLGYKNAEMRLQRGAALLGLKRYAEAASELEAFERLQPGRGQTSLLLGRSYRGMGRLDAAQARLREAARRDPLLFEAAREEMRAMGKDLSLEVLESALGQGGAQGAESPRAQALRPRVLPSAGRARPAGPVTRGGVQMGAGLNSNVVALNGDFVATDISSVSSPFIQTIGEVQHDESVGANGTRSAGYYFLGNTYSRLKTFDLADHTVWGYWRPSGARDQFFSLSLSDEYTLLGDRQYRNGFSVRPAYSWKAGRQHWLEVAYTLTLAGYFIPVAPALDRSGTTQSAGITDYYSPGRSKVQLRFGYYHLWNATKGTDFDYDSDGLTFNLYHPMGRKDGRFDLTVLHSWDRYANLNSLAGTAGFAFQRDDTVDRATAQVLIPLVEKLRAFLRYEYLTVDSNVLPYDFNQKVTLAGLNVRF